MSVEILRSMKHLVSRDLQKLCKAFKDRNIELKFTLCDQQYADLKHLAIVLGYQKDCRNLGRLVIKGKIFEKLVKQLLLTPGSDGKEQYGYHLKKETAIDTYLCMTFFFLFSNHIVSLDAKFSRMHKIKITCVEFIFFILSLS